MAMRARSHPTDRTVLVDPSSHSNFAVTTLGPKTSEPKHACSKSAAMATTSKNGADSEGSSWRNCRDLHGVSGKIKGDYCCRLPTPHGPNVDP